jgi:hypothetical protein
MMIYDKTKVLPGPGRQGSYFRAEVPPGATLTSGIIVSLLDFGCSGVEESVELA